MPNYLDTEGVAFVWKKIKDINSTKVDKIQGKGLSTHDFTTLDKDKLNSIEFGAENDIINAYPLKSSEELSYTWLSKTENGPPLIPLQGKIYILMTATENYSAKQQFFWNGKSYVNLIDIEIECITNSEIEDIMNM